MIIKNRSLSMIRRFDHDFLLWKILIFCICTSLNHLISTSAIWLTSSCVNCIDVSSTHSSWNCMTF
jgi:hypothetical protein